MKSTISSWNGCLYFEALRLDTYPGLETKYLIAKQSVDDGGNLLMKGQYRALNLFEYLFNKFVFGDISFYVSSQTTNIQSRQACDIVIECETPDGAWKILCFAKRAVNGTETLVTAIEGQALGYCKDFLTANPGIDKGLACTIIGGSIRCWTYSQGDEDLLGFWDSQFRDSYRYYLDIGDDANIARLNHAFNLIKSIAEFHRSR
ncbi:unnamed protein product [Clonostachys byssicola]|uniref:Uncharacterized protein n=1 Tax=Clonostachys byssicola TaxID=160290 RepID=A0A9N9U6J5_9HYPO|nr:unnamed protein product [Clonostachys byssicola]